MRRAILSLLLLFLVCLGAQGQSLGPGQVIPRASYLSNGAGGWDPWSSVGAGTALPYVPLAIGLYCSADGGVTWIPCISGGGGGGGVSVVSSANFSPLFNVAVTNSTTTPHFAYTAINQSPNLIYAGPTSGSAAAPGFRALVAADIPSLPYLPSSTQLPVTNAGSAHNFVTSYSSVTGLFATGQPSFADISSTLGLAQGPSSITGFLYDTAGTLSAGTAAAMNTLLGTLTGCGTATYLLSPQAGGCVAPSGGGGGAPVIKNYAFLGCYGDSFMAETFAPAADGICSLMAQAMPGIYSVNSHNYGVSSQTTQTTIVTSLWPNFAIYPQRPSMTIALSGNNDGTVQGTGADALLLAQENYQAAIGHTVIPLQSTFYASHCTPSGSWSADTTLGATVTPNGVTSTGTPMLTTSSGASETCSIPTSASTWLGIRFELAHSRGGTFTVNVDGTLRTSPDTGTTTWSSNPPGNTTTGGASVVPSEYFITGLTPGTHSVVVTTTNASQVTFDAVQWLPSDCATSCGGFQLIGGNAAYTGASNYDTAFASMITTVQGLGLPVWYASQINGTPGVNATTDIGAASQYCNATGSANHPNTQCGYVNMAKTIYATEVALSSYWSRYPAPPMNLPAGSGLVNTIGITTANGVSGTSSGGANPLLTIALGAITPTSVNGVSAATMAFVDPTSSIQGQFTGKAASGANSDITSLSGLTTPLTGTQGGTGVNNGARTLTLAGNVAFTGAFNPTFAIPSSSTYTFPSGSDTMATLAATQTFTNKSIAATQLTGTLQAAQEPAHTGDVTNSAASLALTIAANAVTGAKMANATITALQLAAQYSKGSCTEAWGGSGTSFALVSGDDSIGNNSCYNTSGVTRTITAVQCLSDNASNTTTVNPTFGASGTGTTVLSGALTCGNSNAMSSTGTVSNASWATATGINPAMGGTLTGTHIVMIVSYTF